MLSTDNRDLKLDSNNSLVLVNGDFQWTRGLDGVVQDCLIRLSMFRGEWFLDRTVGISYWGEILGKKPQRAIAAITSEFYQALMSVEDVVDVLRLDITYNGGTRTVSVRWVVKTQFGDSPLQIFDLNT